MFNFDYFAYRSKYAAIDLLANSPAQSRAGWHQYRRDVYYPALQTLTNEVEAR